MIKHEKIIKEYEEGKQELFEQVIKKIKEITPSKASKITNKSKQYINDLIHKNKYISYDALIALAKVLFKI